MPARIFGRLVFIFNSRRDRTLAQCSGVIADVGSSENDWRNMSSNRCSVSITLARFRRKNEEIEGLIGVVQATCLRHQ